MPPVPASVAPVVLIIRDGWGMNPNPGHASFDAVRIASAKGLTPVADRLMRECPWTLIKTCGEDVGLPLNTMGNSEVGHQNIGAGRIVPQESLLMTKACEAGLHTIPAVKRAVDKVLADPSGKASLHLMGINSDAGVHGQLEHLYAMLRACRTLGLAGSRVMVHLFTDGRDTGPFSGKAFAEQVEHHCNAIGAGRVVSICGRYYAMDRDYRWERVKTAYDMLTGAGTWPSYTSVSAAIQAFYDSPTNDSQKGDEFITPRLVAKDPADAARTRVKDGDAVIFYNYRGDRPREISAAIVFPDAQWAKVKPSPDSGKPGFDRGRKLTLHYVTMTEYWEQLTPYVDIAFPRAPKMKQIAGEWLSTHNLRQFRCAETEKYPHVTFFFNDYRDEPFPGEQREIIQSPKVATYDLQPEMSAAGVCDAVMRRLAAPDCENLIVVNFANGDMVGHTGKLDAAVKACATVDACVGRIIEATLARGGGLIVTADHGNCEQMWDPETNAPHTAHTLYDVPLIIVGPRWMGRRMRGDQDVSGWFRPAARAGRGRLADVLPTALAMMGVAQPAEMTGTSLLE